MVRGFLLLSLLCGWCFEAESLKYFFEHSVANIPAPEKKHKGGEDAYFANSSVLCVADGVGGWAQYGIDPAIYSRRLAANVEKFFLAEKEKFTKNPKALIVKAAQNNKELGTSTLVIAILDSDDATLRASYIGDSSYIILRNNAKSGKLEIVYRSKEQQHRFNFPFQIGYEGNSPELALSFSHQLQPEDIVVVGTDGLFDNVHNSDIADIVEGLKNAPPQVIADKLAETAFDFSLDETHDSPFAQEAKKANLYFLGGKSDDITVAIGRVKLSQINPNESSEL